ncbi:zinc finger protein 420-like [Contarinia nasturtii]|uniref:zinc finger protein 420-like n=1 Tax=Contarinia nasturtii TaxID=265458 RepID=UPI0012D3F99C|nr:zinc finger protein 420-like [Contarinia nasturtii]
MIVYKTPSTGAFHYRKQFHATQKPQSECISDWFKRLQNSIEKCEFERFSDYMLIDKFVSGLNDSDFDKISQVSTWTTEELILVVIGNAHIFRNLSMNSAENNDGIEIVDIQIKNEEKDVVTNETEYGSCLEFQNKAECESDYHEDQSIQFENNEDELFTTKREKTTEPNSKKEKRSRRDNIERNKKHIEMLKRTGRYEEYKRKKAESAKNRRMKTKQNEQYLPPELQLHLINERRRATRERVKRWRDRKSQKPTDRNYIACDERIQTEIVMIDEAIETEDRGYDEGDRTKVSIDESSLLISIDAKRCLRKYMETKAVKSKRKYQKPNKEFECYLCLLKCRRLYELRAHINVYHPVEKREVFNCPQCTKTTISREVLSRHLKKYHGTIKMHKCPCCDEEFSKRGLLHDHLHMHPDYRPFICETCGNGYKTINELNSHHRKHSGIKEFQCGVCNMLLVSRSSYRSHMLTHTGEKPYPCSLCHKKFRQLSSLRKHLISIHNQGEKPHLCTTCMKRFSSIYHLRIHNNVHTGARPYKCLRCDSTFSQPSALKAHTDRIHEKKQQILFNNKFNMPEYKTPSISAILHRKSFHANQKQQYETIEEWFQRVFESVGRCDYGQLSDFMLIDKFITGLDAEIFNNLELNAILTVDKLLPTVFGLLPNLYEVDSGEEKFIISHQVHENHSAVEGDDTFSKNDGNAHTEFYDINNCDRAELSNIDVKIENFEEPDEISHLENTNQESSPVDLIAITKPSSAYRVPKTQIKGFKRVKNQGIVCLDCDKVFKHKNSYNYHKRTHTGNNLYNCNQCQKVYVKEVQLKAHLQTHKYDNKSFECYICSTKYERIHGLRIHFVSSHIEKKVRNLKCPTCVKVFSNQRDLDLHIKIHQGLVKQHNCQQCEKKFDKASQLREHQVVHLETTDFVCEICGRLFKTKQLMKKHLQRHNNALHIKCPECDRVLASKQILKIHMRQHTGERPYSCHLCEKTFVTQPSLAKHVRVHRQEKPYGCKICNKRFATTYHLKLHLNTHTGAKPFACNQCDKAYTQSGTLKQHQSKAHPETHR